MKKNWRPGKTFVKKVVDFPGADFNSLYGKKTMPDSRYIFLYDNAPEKRPYPYLVGEDERNAGEIWKSIEPLIANRAKEMLESDIVRSYRSGGEEYVGKLFGGYVVIAKELILPRKFNLEVEKHAKNQGREDSTEPIEDIVLSGKMFVELKQDELFRKRLARILEREGARLGNKTVVDVEMYADRTSYTHSIGLMERAAGVLKGWNYGLEDMPLMDFGLFDKPGYAMADITGLVESSERFVGEVKLIEPLLPCGKTPSQREVEWNAIWKAFRKEERRGLRKTHPSMPNIPCGFIEGRSQCVPQWCKTGSRGEYVKKGDAEKTELKGESKDLLNEEQGKNVGDIADSVMRLYRAFGMLKEKERGYR